MAFEADDDEPSEPRSTPPVRQVEQAKGSQARGNSPIARGNQKTEAERPVKRILSRHEKEGPNQRSVGGIASPADSAALLEVAQQKEIMEEKARAAKLRREEEEQARVAAGRAAANERLKKLEKEIQERNESKDQVPSPAPAVSVPAPVRILPSLHQKDTLPITGSELSWRNSSEMEKRNSEASSVWKKRSNKPPATEQSKNKGKKTEEAPKGRPANPQQDRRAAGAKESNPRNKGKDEPSGESKDAIEPSTAAEVAKPKRKRNRGKGQNSAQKGKETKREPVSETEEVKSASPPNTPEETLPTGSVPTTGAESASQPRGPTSEEQTAPTEAKLASLPKASEEKTTPAGAKPTSPPQADAASTNASKSKKKAKKGTTKASEEETLPALAKPSPPSKMPQEEAPANGKSAKKARKQTPKATKPPQGEGEANRTDNLPPKEAALEVRPDSIPTPKEEAHAKIPEALPVAITAATEMTGSVAPKSVDPPLDVSVPPSSSPVTTPHTGHPHPRSVKRNAEARKVEESPPTKPKAGAGPRYVLKTRAPTNA